MSLYGCHQSWVLACRAISSSCSRSASPLIPYRLSRSATSRCLAAVRPRSSRLIFDGVARIALAASAVVMLLSSRSRRRWVPSAIRNAVGPRRGLMSALSARAPAGAPLCARSEIMIAPRESRPADELAQVSHHRITHAQRAAKRCAPFPGDVSPRRSQASADQVIELAVLVSPGASSWILDAWHGPGFADGPGPHAEQDDQLN